MYLTPFKKYPPAMKKTALGFLCFLCTLMGTAQTSQAGDLETQKALEDYVVKLLDSSNSYYFKGNYVKSLACNIDIIELALELNDPIFLHRGYRYLGYDYLALEDSTLAKESFEKAERYARLAKNDTAIAQGYMDQANMYSAGVKNYEKALFYHTKSIEMFEKIHDSLGLGKAHYNTVLTLFNAKNHKHALPHLKAMEGLEKFQNDAFKMGYKNQWGEYYFHQKDYINADKYFKIAIEDSLSKTFPVELSSTYSNYSESLYAQEKFKEAFDIRLLYESYNQQNISTQQTEESEKISAKFQLAEYKKSIRETAVQNELQAQILKSKSSLNTLLLIISGASILLLLFLFIVYRKRKEFIKKLEIKNREYLDAKEESERLAKSKTAFFSTVSHELRTPLYGVIGLSTILLEDETLKSHKEDIKSLKFSADYLMALINDVLQINKIDSKRMEEDQVVFNIRELVKVIIPSFEYIRIQHNNIIQIDIADEVPTMLKGDSIRLSQVLMNLIGNACKFTENGIITIGISSVSITETKTTLHFSIKDNGIGIPAEKQAQIFDEFAQVSSKHYNYQGTGLGLPIVKKLLALSDAEIKLESTIGEGSNFYFDLSFDPYVQESIIETPATTVLDEEILRNKNILIVDDNRINQIVTTKILEKRGVICTLASNGEEAVTLAQSSTFDLILMDIHMPKKNGMEATMTIRTFNPNIPIIALTAVEVKEMRHRIYESGMNDIIVKPYDITKFKRTILRNLICPIPREKDRRKAI